MVSDETLIIEDVVDLYYLTKLDLSAGFLCYSGNEQRLFVDGRYIEEAKGAFLRSDENIVQFLKKYKKVRFDSESTSYNRYLSLKKLAKAAGCSLLPIKSPIKKQRAIKTKEEIQKLKKAAALGYLGFEFVKSRLKEGVTEEEVANALKIFWLQRGASGVAFEPIIAFGKNSSKPHHRAGKTALKKNEIALIDIGVTLNHYHSDMTQTYFLGKPNPKLQKIYAIVEEAQEEALQLCKAGTPIRKLDEKARAIIKKYGYGEQFKHSLGHGLGLEVHEHPILKVPSEHQDLPLEEGMVITIEPGIYLDNLGGVRLEKSILIKKNGYEDLILA